MQYGICNLSIVPLRLEPAMNAEQTSQVLFGEFFKVLDRRKHWSRIRLAFDKFEGWIDNKQYTLLEESVYKVLEKEPAALSADLVEFVFDDNNNLMPVPLGCNTGTVSQIGFHFDGRKISGKNPKEDLIKTAFLYLNCPELRGGKTPFGIDAAGFAQMVYHLNGYQIKRQADEQAKMGDALSFIEESEPGDLAFFDNEEGVIVHVGIIMENNYIIHVDGKVRIDRIDHSGIFNVDSRTHTHKLRVIKKII
ncbi:NlpC/P60 family protein [Robertkochia solimangrovi]|uniref:C40 family peptidase n=1 Tax=Robertkochia solimangrovi TaxID=2213046 RepID=UPI001180257F|nr:NlpC/P60 family protein [Robertkochia solimangrovi]TRZ42917.1 hydrolase Nlp/P60 [Robertkochia solimangrovi]